MGNLFARFTLAETSFPKEDRVMLHKTRCLRIGVLPKVDVYAQTVGLVLCRVSDLTGKRVTFIFLGSTPLSQPPSLLFMSAV